MHFLANISLTFPQVTPLFYIIYVFHVSFFFFQKSLNKYGVKLCLRGYTLYYTTCYSL